MVSKTMIRATLQCRCCLVMTRVFTRLKTVFEVLIDIAWTLEKIHDVISLLSVVIMHRIRKCVRFRMCLSVGLSMNSIHTPKVTRRKDLRRNVEATS